MHDIDRTMMEYQPEMEYDPEMGYDPEMEMEFESESEYDEFEYSDQEGVLDEADEMALAAELLEITDESELDQFFGRLFKKIGRASGNFIRSPVGQALGGILKSAAKKALPIAGAGLGTMIGGPFGTALGSQLATAGGNMFGLELEGLSQEDQEFEIAKNFVKFAGSAAEIAATTSPSVSPQAAAKSAAVTAAQTHAPGLLRPARRPNANPYAYSSGRSGRWQKRGRKIILYGV